MAAFTCAEHLEMTMQDDIMTLHVVRRDIHTNEIAVIDLAADSGADRSPRSHWYEYRGAQRAGS